jgi:hypothetical protein
MQKEHEQQCAYFRWARYAYPKKIIFANPNAGLRTPRQGKWMKDEGLLAGIPDIMVASAKGEFHGLFIEMKTENGRMSDSQTEIKARLESEGYRVEVCRGWVEAKQLTETYLNE